RRRILRNMTYLLDTHHMLWAVADTKKLSKEVIDVITDPENKIIISTISFWEVSLKASLGKMELRGFSPEDFPDACVKASFTIEGPGHAECSTYHQLKATYHNDPFDRMLIWQSICSDYTLISADSQVKKYVSEGLKVWKEK
ncbi:MAG TPA: type II toxin-antitoxin system VapC family toxin, partial [Puia sp.]|nr:type II toxin-antitoxin system VapC family toxin [Puia sp.]